MSDPKDPRDIYILCDPIHLEHQEYKEPNTEIYKEGVLMAKIFVPFDSPFHPITIAQNYAAQFGPGEYEIHFLNQKIVPQKEGEE